MYVCTYVYKYIYIIMCIYIYIYIYSLYFTSFDRPCSDCIQDFVMRITAPSRFKLDCGKTPT